MTQNTPSATTANQFAIEALDHVALTVRDPQASMAWYQHVFGFVPASMVGLECGPPFILRVSPGCYLNLFPADTLSPDPVPNHNCIAMRHVAFRVSYESISDVEEKLVLSGQHVSAFDYGPSCRSLFISDPDGHQLELIGYADGVFTS